jgi:uncharacterized protein
MSEGHHDLAHEFPEHKQAIHELKQHDGHFTRLADDYHNVCKELHRIEAGNETPADDYVEALKVRRLHLKDDLYAMLKNAQQ